MAIRITDDMMTLEIDDRVVATARFSECAAADGDGAWIVSTYSVRLFSRDAEEFYRQLKGVVIDDTDLFNDKLQEWQGFSNYHRPHGALDGQTPYERLRQKTIAQTPE